MKNRLKGEITGIFILQVFALAAIAVAVASFVTGCAPLPTTPDASGSNGGTNPAQGGASVRVGWVDDYSKFIEQSVSPELLAYEPTSFCPRYTQLVDKRKFWSALFRSIAAPESGFDRTQRYREPGMRDAQGRQVYSEGLLQLSLQDAANYRTPACLKMIDKPAKPDTDPTRAIFDPYVNLGCGMEIAARLVALHPHEYFSDALGRYWSSVRDGKVKAYFEAHFAGSVGCK